MADSLNSIGSIATFIVNSLNFISPGVSGQMINIVDVNRQYVSQYTGQSIPANGISENYQGAIVNFSLSDTIKMVLAEGETTLGELSWRGGGATMSAEQYRLMGENQLKVLGRHVTAVRSLS